MLNALLRNACKYLYKGIGLHTLSRVSSALPSTCMCPKQIILFMLIYAQGIKKQQRDVPTFCIRNNFSYFSAGTSDPLLNDNISLCDKIMSEIKVYVRATCMQAGRLSDWQTDRRTAKSSLLNIMKLTMIMPPSYDCIAG